MSYAFTETAFGYPLTTSTFAFECVDAWAKTQQRKNAFGSVPTLVMMQNENGAAGALSGIENRDSVDNRCVISRASAEVPNLFKLRYAQVPAVVHVASRALFTPLCPTACDHSDVDAVRAGGVPMVSSATAQDVDDLSAAADASAIEASVPFLHFYDGYRTSHQLSNVEVLSYEELVELVDHDALEPGSVAGHTLPPQFSCCFCSLPLYSTCRMLVG